METLDPHTLAVLSLGAGLGVVLVRIAQRYRLLEHRDEGRCPACGVLRRRGVCSCFR